MQLFKDIHGFNHFDLTFCKPGVVEKYLQGELLSFFKDVIATVQASTSQNQQKHTIFYACFCKNWMFFIKIDPTPHSVLNMTISFKGLYYRFLNIEDPALSQPTKIELRNFDPKTDIPWIQVHALKNFATLDFNSAGPQELATILEIKKCIATAK